MARDDVNIKVSADVAEAIRMWRAMEQGPQGMANELDALGRKGKAAGSGMEAEFGKLVGKWGSIGGAIMAAKQAIDLLINAQRQYNEMVKNASVPVDTMSRQFMVQGGLTNQQGQIAKQQILQIAQQRAVTPETAFGAGTQMQSSGFTTEQIIQGGGLNEFLKLLNATNATGRNVDPVDLAKSMTLFLEATGQQKTGAAQGALGRQIQGLFKSTNIQTNDLGSFAKEAGKINQFFPELKNQQLALLSQFEGVANVEIGGTALRAALSRIRTAGGTPEQQAALKSLGLSFSDVDDESFLQVQDTLTKAFQRTDAATGNIAAKKLFGDEGMLAKQVLFTPEGQALTRERMGMAADEAGFQRDVAITEGSLAARERASQSAAAGAFAQERFLDPETVLRNIILEVQRQGGGRLSQSLQGAAFDAAMMLPGADAESALQMVFPGVMTKNVEARNRIIGQSENKLPNDIKVNVTLTDQDAVAIPHKSAVTGLSKAK